MGRAGEAKAVSGRAGPARAPFLSRRPPRVRSVPVVAARPGAAGAGSAAARLVGMEGRTTREEEDARLSLEDEAPLSCRGSP